MSQLRTVLHCREGFLSIETANVFRGCVGDDGNGVVTDHRVGFVCCQFPNRQSPPLFILSQKRANKVAGPFLINNCVKRMGGSKSVPEREDGVVGKTFSLVALKVVTAILSIYIHEQVR